MPDLAQPNPASLPTTNGDNDVESRTTPLEQAAQLAAVSPGLLSVVGQSGGANALASIHAASGPLAATQSASGQSAVTLIGSDDSGDALGKDTAGEKPAAAPSRRLIALADAIARQNFLLKFVSLARLV